MQIKEQTKTLKQADGVLLSEHVWVYTFTYALQVHLPAIQPDWIKSMHDFSSPTPIHQSCLLEKKLNRFGLF